MNDIIFNELDKLTRSKLAKGFPENNLWQAVPFETGEVKGVGLLASECCEPEELELNLNVSGVYKIYICLGYIGNYTSVDIRLSNDYGRTLLVPSETDFIGDYCRWQRYEIAEECFFKVADLTGQRLIINKPKKFLTPTAQSEAATFVLYIRLEPLNESEVAEYNNSNLKHTICYHLDNDFVGDCDHEKAEDYMGVAKMLDHGNGDSIIIEAAFDKADYNRDKGEYTIRAKRYRPAFELYQKNSEKFKELLSAYAHQREMKIYTGFRMGFSDYLFPYSPSCWNSGEQDIYSEYKCENRMGKTMQFLSYSYPEVRQFMIERILEVTPDSYDGVSLFFHRGTLVLFEKPVCDLVKARYNVDAHRLPFADKRLHSVLCEFITQFIRELKEALFNRASKEKRKPYLINAIVYQDIESSLNFGYDVEEWAKEGLIDSFSQGIMVNYEELMDSVGEDGLIDLKRYGELLKNNVLLRRKYDSAIEQSMEGIPEFVKISNKYGVDFYGNFAWESSPYELQLELAKSMYRAGVKKMLAWNANHMAKKPAVLSAVKESGDSEKILNDKVKVFKKIVRVLSLNGCDISEFDANWKG